MQVTMLFVYTNMTHVKNHITSINFVEYNADLRAEIGSLIFIVHESLA